jgi:hypothetical protein
MQIEATESRGTIGTDPQQKVTVLLGIGTMACELGPIATVRLESAND